MITEVQERIRAWCDDYNDPIWKTAMPNYREMCEEAAEIFEEILRRADAGAA